MQKQQVSFFERHVQWFAVGLGALFLAFMVYQYVLSSPIRVTAGGKEFAPGEIDEATLEGPVVELQQAIANPVVPEIENVDHITQFLATINGGQQFPLMSENTFAARPMSGTVTGSKDDGPSIGDPPVLALPVPPPPKPDEFNFGRSTVVLLDPDFKFNPKKPNLKPKEVELDKDWWSGAFKISSEQLAQAFQKAFDVQKIEAAGFKEPGVFMRTAFVDVELVRQERQPDGTWGKQVVVKPLPISDRLPFPGEAAEEEVISEYLDWAISNRAELLTPAFYQVLTGDDWEAPGEEPGVELAAEDREKIRERNLARAKEREERKQAAAKAERDRRRQEAQARRAAGAQRGAAGGGGGGPGGAGGGPGAMQMPPGGMGGPPAGTQGGPNTYGGPGGMGAGMGPGMGQGGPGGPGGAPTNPYANMPGMGRGAGAGAMAMPGGRGGGGAGWLDAADAGDDILIIAHDDTVQPGKTYRYAVRYRILNPVYKAFQAAPADLTKQFSIASKYSAWTKPVTIRPKVEFFLAQVRAQKAHFDVFEWRDGKRQKRRIEVNPGDAIGDTGFSVVDVRGSGSRAYGLIMDRTGDVDRYNPEEREPSPRYQNLLDEAAGAELGMR